MRTLPLLGLAALNPCSCTQLQALRDEVNHKFSVQVAENKRLQSQMQKHASDMSKVSSQRSLSRSSSGAPCQAACLPNTAVTADGGHERTSEASRDRNWPRLTK